MLGTNKKPNFSLTLQWRTSGLILAVTGLGVLIASFDGLIEMLFPFLVIGIIIVAFDRSIQNRYRKDLSNATPTTHPTNSPVVTIIKTILITMLSLGAAFVFLIFLLHSDMLAFVGALWLILGIWNLKLVKTFVQEEKKRDIRFVKKPWSWGLEKLHYISTEQHQSV